MRSKIIRLVTCLAFLVNVLIVPSAGIFAAEGNTGSGTAGGRAAEFTADFFNAMSKAGSGVIPSDPIGIEPRPAVLKAVTLKDGVKPSDRYIYSFSQVHAVDNTVDSNGNPMIPPVGDQGKVGSCLTWASAYYYKTYQEKLNHPEFDVTNPRFQFSPSFLFNQLNGGDANPSYISYMPSCFQMFVNKGCCSLEDMPYSSTNITSQPSPTAFNNARQFRAASWRWLANIDALAHFLAFTKPEDYNESIKPYIGDKALDDIGNIFINNIKQCLVNGDLCVVGVPIFGEFDSYIGGILDAQSHTGNFRGSHALTVVGYDDNKQAFRIVNSWGTTDWGKEENGYCWLSYEYSKRNMLTMAWQEDRDTPLAQFTAEPVEAGVKLTWNDGNNYAYDNESVQSYVITFSAPGIPERSITLTDAATLKDCTYTLRMDNFYNATYTFTLKAMYRYFPSSSFTYPQRPVVPVHSPNAPPQQEPAIPGEPDEPGPGSPQINLEEAKQLLENFVKDKIKSHEGDIKQFFINTVGSLIRDISVKDTTINYKTGKAHVSINVKYSSLRSVPSVLYLDMRVNNNCSQLGLCLPDDANIFGKEPKTGLQFWYPENQAAPSSSRPFTVEDTINVVNNVVTASSRSQTTGTSQSQPSEPVQAMEPAGSQTQASTSGRQASAWQTQPSVAGTKGSSSQTSSSPVPPEFLDNSLPPAPEYATTGFDRVRGITFFTDKDYKGSKLFLENSTRSLSTKFDDKITSVKISNGYYAVVYEKPDYEGASKEIRSDAANLDSKWNDKISSIKVYKTILPGMDQVNGFSTAAGGTEGVTFFEHTDFKGAGMCLTKGALTLDSKTNNKISSVKVTPGYTAVVFDNLFNLLQTKSISSDIANLGNWNDRISSIIIHKSVQLPESPVVPPPDGVTFYGGSNCTGASMTLDHSARTLDRDTDNKIMSAKVNPGYMAIIYQDTDYSGKSMVLTENTPLSGGYLPSDFKGTVSSIRVAKVDDFNAETVVPLNKTILEQHILQLLRSYESYIRNEMKKINDRLKLKSIEKLVVDSDKGKAYVDFKFSFKGLIFTHNGKATLELELRTSSDYSQFGVCFTRLTKLDIDWTILNIIDGIIKKWVNNNMMGQQFWFPDGYAPSSYTVVKTDSLPAVINSVISKLLRENPMTITQTLEGGEYTGSVTLTLKDVQCKAIDLNTGSVVIGGTLQVGVSNIIGTPYSEVGSVDIGLIFYLNRFDNNWWVRVRGISNMDAKVLDARTREILCKEITKNLGSRIQAIKIGALKKPN